MGREVELGQIYHLLQSRVCRSQQQVVIAVAVNSGVDGVDVAAIAAILQDVKELITIKAVGESCQDLALADTIADTESGRNSFSKSDVGELLDVHVDYEYKKDGAELEQHFLEQD